MKGTLQFTVQSFSEADPEIRRIMEDDANRYVMSGEKIYFRIGNRIYNCEKNEDSKLLIRSFLEKEPAEQNCCSETKLWQKVLEGKESSMVLQNYGTYDNIVRCVILFRPSPAADNRLFQDSIPLDGTDRLVKFENGDAAVVLNMAGRTMEEAEEYAAAVTQTMESEAGISCIAGIGRAAETLPEISQQYREALCAIETGVRHKMEGKVFRYEKQVLERMADLIPSKSAEKARTELIPQDTKKIMTDEMVETIRAFFRNNLNLSTTARQLFIHRNTLLYRMEKIRKATGLDLRKFEDAAIFRFLMCIPSIGDDHTGF